jgi:RNA polymerase I-specific transcription initiation factor RRN6
MTVCVLQSVMPISTNEGVESCVLLHSRLNNLTQTYTIDNSSFGSAARVSSTDPTLLSLAVDSPSHTLQVTMEPCRFQGDTISTSPSLGRAYLRRGFTFYKLFMLKSDLSLHEILLYATSSSNANTSLYNDAVEDLFWTITYRPKKDVRTIGDIQEMDDFLEPEGIWAIEEPIPKRPMQVPKSTNGKVLDIAHRAVDHRSLYDALSRSGVSEEPEGNIDVPTLVTRLQEVLMTIMDTSQVPLGTL